MLSDAQTWRDLELFEARDGGSSVLTTLDRTRTQAGHRRLREILRTPSSDPEWIRSRHASVRYLAASESPFRLVDDAVRRVRRYLDSNFATLARWPAPVSALEAVWIAVRYPELVRHARQGVGATGHLVRSMARYADGLAADGMPEGLEDLVRETRGIAETLAPVLSNRRSPWALLWADRTLREDLRDAVERLLEIAAELDALGAAARLLDEGYVLPEIEDHGTELDGEGLWHPFVSRAVGNPVELVGGDALVFLTGPNMAGKTTYLKAVGLSLHLAHCGLPVPASRFRFTPMDRLITGLAPEDNLRNGISFFLAEVRRVKEVVAAVARTERTVAIFDEVFRGTNVTDALEAT
ncbi:MAG: hypothetical protein KDA28_05505, partial [Phycisphaerales bacterium]|nr:hypothetical protein [Phycisphaerales bacterium]